MVAIQTISTMPRIPAAAAAWKPTPVTPASQAARHNGHLGSSTSTAPESTGGTAPEKRRTKRRQPLPREPRQHSPVMTHLSCVRGARAGRLSKAPDVPYGLPSWNRPFPMADAPALCSAPAVLVMPPPPDARLVPPLGGAVEPLVHAPESVQSTRVGGIGVVDGPVLQDERAHARPVAVERWGIGSAHGRELVRRCLAA